MSLNHTRTTIDALRRVIIKKGGISFKKYPTRRYPARTWNRNESYRARGRGIAYRRDRTPPAYIRSETTRRIRYARGLREPIKVRTSGPIKTNVYSSRGSQQPVRPYEISRTSHLTCGYESPREALLSYEYKPPLDLLTLVYRPY